MFLLLLYNDTSCCYGNVPMAIYVVTMVIFCYGNIAIAIEVYFKFMDIKNIADLYNVHYCLNVYYMYTYKYT